MAGHWCILKTQGRYTLRLADTLAADGFEVWTPRRTSRVSVRRANVKREVTQPIMPGYLFAREHHLVELLQMAKMEVRPRRGVGWGRPAHAKFSVMKHGDVLPIIADKDLNEVRRIEKKAELDRIRVKKAEPFKTGVRVRVKEGSHDAWGGMIGRVVKSDAGNSKVVFYGGKIEVTIRTILLSADELGQERSLTGTSRQEAA